MRKDYMPSQTVFAASPPPSPGCHPVFTLSAFPQQMLRLAGMIKKV
jgi:hypothetical protein